MFGTKKAVSHSGMPSLLHDAIHAPVYLFQMGKVGSSSLRATLTEHLEGNIYHAHTYRSMSPRGQRQLRWRRHLHLPVFVICPVRDPVSRNVSSFFQNFKRDTGFEISEKPWTTPELVELFLRCYPHNDCLEWFDRNFRGTFGIDVFSEPFPVERKWNVYRRGSVKALVFCSDLDHAEQLAIVSEFLSCEIKKWTYENQAEDKEYRDLYRDFVATARLPELYLTILGGSRFCQRFWSKDEIAAQARKWRREVPGSV